MKKSTVYTIIALGLFAAFGAFYQIRSSNKLGKNGIYTIVTIEKIKGGGRGCGIDIYVSFTYKKIEHKKWYDCFTHAQVSENPIGKRFFMKFIPNDKGFFDKSIDILYHCPVPDTLQAPPEGWSQEWMEEHFPDCVK